MRRSIQPSGYITREWGRTGPDEDKVTESGHPSPIRSVCVQEESSGRLTVSRRNIDRLCAMWQAINPNTYVTGQASSQPTLTTEEGTIENVRTPLTPFWKNPDEFYTSTDVRRTERFGNAYLETQPWNFESTRDYQASVRTAFRNLYGGSNLAFILASAQGGALSTGPQIQLPQANQSRSGLQRPLQVSAMVLPSVQHGHDSKQIPLRESKHGGDSSKGRDNPKDVNVPQNVKDTGKDTGSSQHDEGKGAKHHG